MMRSDSGRIGVAAVAAGLAILALVVLITFLVKTTGDGARPVQSAEAPSATTDRPPPAEQKPSAAAIRPRPFAESETADAAASSRAGVLEIEVVLASGAPAAKARLALYLSDEHCIRTTDTEGRARFSPGDGEASLRIVPDGGPAHTTTIPIQAGHRRVQLPAGVSITGRVEVDRGPPAESVTLRFWNAATDLSDARERRWILANEMPTCTTTASGRFAFAGVSPGSEWAIAPTFGWRIDRITVDEKVVTEVSAPASGVVVDVTRLPVISGRVVLEGGNGSVEESTCTSCLAGPVGSSVNRVGIDKDGKFRFEIAADPKVRYSRLDVTIRGPKGVGEKVIVLEPPPDRDRDLGDIQIPAGRELAFLVRDPAGAPIEDAFAALRGGHVEQPTRTDKRGRGVIAVGDEAKGFRVGALRYEVVDVPVPRPLPELLTVTLAPVAGLAVQVVAPEGVGAGFFRVRLSSETQGLLGERQLGNDPIRVAAGAGGMVDGAGIDDRGTILSFIPDPENRVVIAGIMPATPLLVEARDPMGQVGASVRLTLGAGEWRDLELRVTRKPSSVRGRVRDSGGKAVEGAFVEVEAEGTIAGACGAPDGGGLSGQTDAAGRFEVSRIFATTVNVTVRMPGFSPLVRRAVPVAPEGVELDLTLQKGCVLTVLVAEAKGAPIAGLMVSAEAEGHPADYSVTKEPGIYVFSNFPMNVAATVKFEWAGREWTRPIDVKGEHTERIVMPAMGTLVVDWAALDLPDTVLVLNLTTADERTTGTLLARPPPGSTAPREEKIAPVQPGEYVLAVETQEGRPAASAARATVKGGETTRVVLRKP